MGETTMSVTRLMRSAAASALIAVGSATAFDAVAQSIYDDSSGQTSTPPRTEPGAGASDRSRDQNSNPMGSQGGNVRSGSDTGQGRATPGNSGRGDPSSPPNCPTTPPNAAECPTQSPPPGR